MAQNHKWNMADTITSARMVFSLFLLFMPPRFIGFFAVYTLAGLTDALDGWLARKMGLVSEFGARLDSMADLLFYGVLLVRLFPVMRQALPVTIWYAVAVILIVRLAAYAVAAIRYHRFASLHTWLNKLTGASIFLLPYVLAVSSGVGYSWAVCGFAFAASLEECVIHFCQPDYQADRRFVFQRK